MVMILRPFVLGAPGVSLALLHRGADPVNQCRRRRLPPDGKQVVKTLLEFLPLQDT